MELRVAATQRPAVLEGCITFGDPAIDGSISGENSEPGDQRNCIGTATQTVWNCGVQLAWMRYVRVTIKPRVAVIACCALSGAAWLGVQWWPRQPPEDFEQCAEEADRTASSPDERVSLIARCNQQFIGRRKPGGGYTYYDFLQNRHFDIAGPNPTPSELKYFDEEYALYLDTQRRDAVAAAIAEKQNQSAQLELGDYRLRGAIDSPDARMAFAPTNVPIPRPVNAAARAKRLCEDAFLSCSWARFATGIRNFLGSNAKVSRR